MSRRKNSNSIMKRFGIGLCSGILGGAIYDIFTNMCK